MRIAVGADHAGVPLKRDLLALLEAEGHETLDLGSDGPEPVDYPDFARAVGEAVARGEAERGLLVCGSGIGTSMAANKIPGVRAALSHDTYSARQGVEHDDVNVLCLGARVIGPELAAEIVRAWLAARFSGEERHVRRLGKLRAIEAQYCRGE
ncbi:MAG: ribose 5-phosphate isomerase B [Chloroflexi bacterium]|nr:ribose 5-phosphate isomerase B [Chloroflexota bacterium]